MERLQAQEEERADMMRQRMVEAELRAEQRRKRMIQEEEEEEMRREAEAEERARRREHRERKKRHRWVLLFSLRACPSSSNDRLVEIAASEATRAGTSRATNNLHRR